MSIKETLDKAYGSIPKEPLVSFDIGWAPNVRGFKYYWLMFVRKLTR
jgi:hypothetical protein